MRNYYLYLDESGNFNEKSNNALPSIVAGFLAEKNCTEIQAKNLLSATKNMSENFAAINIDSFHGMENFNSNICEFVTALLENMSRKNFRLVVFKNSKEYTSINSDVTYLNVFAEGIVNLMHYLLAQTNEEIFLHVMYASRLNVADLDQYGIYNSLDKKSYLERIEERIDWRMLRLRNSDRERIQKNFVIAKANEAAQLMLADAVCFALRGKWKSLTSDMKTRIKALPTLSFSLLEKISWREIQNLLIENRISEAIYSWYMRSTPALIREYEKQFEEAVVNKLKSLSYTAKKFQYEATAQFVGVLVEARDFNAAKKFILI